MVSCSNFMYIYRIFEPLWGARTEFAAVPGRWRRGAARNVRNEFRGIQRNGQNNGSVRVACIKKWRTRNASGPVYWSALLLFRGWDEFLVNAVCCRATETISLYHDLVSSARRVLAVLKTLDAARLPLILTLRPAAAAVREEGEIGRASCRERV